MTEPNTESIILASAEKVFLEKGFDGTSMQSIADEAGINKALLHYYFRSKEKLFNSVFKKAFASFIPPLMETMISNRPLIERIENFVFHYIKSIRKNPGIPLFIIYELNRNPDNLLLLIKKSGINPQMMMFIIESEIDKGNIRKMDPKQFFINLLALCVFPFAAKPLLKGVFFDNNNEDFEKFIDERTNEITLFIKHAIQPI